MISKKPKPDDTPPPQDYYDSRLGYTISKHCNSNKIWNQSGRYIDGGIGSPESIDFFARLLKPQIEGEDKEAYSKRVSYLANKFCAIEDMAFREFIIAASEDGCHWMGEEFSDFKVFYDEYMKWRDDTQSYESKARKMQYESITNMPKPENKDDKFWDEQIKHAERIGK